MLDIRSLENRDIKKLSILAINTFKETFGYSYSNPEDLEQDLINTRSPKYFLSVMDKDTILVAILDNELIGYIQISDVKVKPENIKIQKTDQAINALYIDKKYQGIGIGKKLMNEAFKSKRISNATNVYIDVWDENKKALNLYQNYGFETVDKCKVIVENKLLGYDLVLKFNK